MTKRAAADACVSVFRVRKAADEAPAAPELTDRQHQFIAALLQGQIDGVVFRIDDAEEARVAEALRAAATIENLPVEEEADIVAIPDFEFSYLITAGIDRGPGIEDFHAGLRLQARRKVRLKRNARVRRIAIAIEHNEARRFGLHILPLDGGAFRGRKRVLEIPRQRVIGRRDAPLGENVG